MSIDRPSATLPLEAAEAPSRGHPGASTPVLFAMFKRPEMAVRAFAPIREARPRRLYLSADGPRPTIPGETEACARTRAAVESMIDWPCAVHRDYAASNEGCGRRVSSAISRAFEAEDKLIILEEDCVADATFFRFCDELLHRYADDEWIAMISGNQFIPQGWSPDGASYSFARLAQIWGWATWRRAWANFDLEMTAWPLERAAGLLDRTFRRRRDRRHWARNFDRAQEMDTWGYPWSFARWRRGQAAIVPAWNLVSNIGFAADALHTRAPHHPVANLPTQAMPFPLRHSDRRSFDETLDENSARILFCGGFDAWWNYQRDQRLARWLPWLFPPRDPHATGDI